jgi:hypothetical protein
MKRKQIKFDKITPCSSKCLLYCMFRLKHKLLLQASRHQYNNTNNLRSLLRLTCQRCLTCFLSQTLPVSSNFVTGLCIAVLVSTSLSGYALLNASRAANDFDGNVREMNTLSALQHTMFATAQFLRNCCEYRPSNQGDLALSVWGGRSEETISWGGGTCLRFNFCTVVSDCFGVAF